MTVNQALSIGGLLNYATWQIVALRVLLMVLTVVLGTATPMLRARRRQVRPSRLLAFRSGASALSFMSAIVAICSLLHFSDLRWLPPSQRGGLHLSAPGGLFGSLTGHATAVINSFASIPAEWHAAQIAVPTAITYGGIALVAYGLVLVLGRGARRAEIRQIVQEELARPASRS